MLIVMPAIPHSSSRCQTRNSTRQYRKPLRDENITPERTGTFTTLVLSHAGPMPEYVITPPTCCSLYLRDNGKAAVCLESHPFKSPRPRSRRPPNRIVFFQFQTGGTIATEISPRANATCYINGAEGAKLHSVLSPTNYKNECLHVSQGALLERWK